MAKKRGKRFKTILVKRPKIENNDIRTGFKEKRVVYKNNDSVNIVSKDKELNRVLNELEAQKVYGSKNKPIDKNETDKYESYKGKFQVHETDKKVPTWFYIGSIFAAFMFTIYISIFATIHFDDISNMNIMIVFIFISMVSFFLISAMYFISEKKRAHAIAPTIFFVGIVSVMIYAFKALDTSDLVRFSIIYTIIVVAISTYVLAIKRRE